MLCSWGSLGGTQGPRSAGMAATGLTVGLCKEVNSAMAVPEPHHQGLTPPHAHKQPSKFAAKWHATV